MSGHNRRCSDVEFIRLFEKYGATETAKRLSVDSRNVFQRRRSLEKIHNIKIVSPNQKYFNEDFTSYPVRVNKKIKNGIIIVGSDCHYWPDIVSPAHRAFLMFCKKYAPKLVVLNGDVLDFPNLSKHDLLGWNKTPRAKDELNIACVRLSEIKSSSKGAEHIMTLGNHGARLEKYLANKAGEVNGLYGTTLKDHFPEWEFAGSSIWINDDIVIKHSYKGGVHATHNNTLNAGKTIITGHLHSLKVTPFDDYNGTRYGVDCGTMADPRGPQFLYGDDNPVNHRQGFVVLTIVDELLLWPEVVAVIDDDHVQFRGDIIKV